MFKGTEQTRVTLIVAIHFTYTQLIASTIFWSADLGWVHWEQMEMQDTTKWSKKFTA